MDSPETRAIAIARLALIAGVMVSFVFLIGGLVLETSGARGLNPDLLLNTGIMVLLGTPVVRVLVLAVGFVRGRNSAFAIVGFCILLLLGASVAIGLRGE